MEVQQTQHVMIVGQEKLISCQKKRKGVHTSKKCSKCGAIGGLELFTLGGTTHSTCNDCWNKEDTERSKKRAGQKKCRKCGSVKSSDNFTLCGKSNSVCNECYKPKRTWGQLKCGRCKEHKDRSHYPRRALSTNPKLNRCDECGSIRHEEMQAIARSSLQHVQRRP